MKYPIIITLGGIPWDGVYTALEWYELKKLSDGTSYGSPPTFSKTGKGSFATSDFTPSEDLVGYVYVNHADFTDSPTDRYIPVYLTAYDQGMKTVVDKLPSKSKLAGTANSTGDIQLDTATGKAAATIAAGDIATDAISSASVSSGAVTKMQTGLATPTNITAGTITTATNLTNAPTNGDLTAAMKASVTTAATAATPTVSSVTNPVTVGTINTDVITAVSVNATAVTKMQTGLATPTNITAGTITTVTNLTNAPTNGDLTAAMKNSLNSATPASVQNIVSQTGDAYARIGAAGAGLTAIGDARLANIDTTISSRSTQTSVNSVVTALGSPMQAGASVTVSDKTGFALTAAYDKAKTASAPGDKMDLIDAPNVTALAAIKSGLSTLTRAQLISAIANRVNHSTLLNGKPVIDSYVVDGNVAVTVTYQTLGGENVPTSETVTP